MSSLFRSWFPCRRLQGDDAYLDVTLESTGESSSVPTTQIHQSEPKRSAVLEVSESTDTSNSEGMIVSNPTLTSNESRSRPSNNHKKDTTATLAMNVSSSSSKHDDFDAVSAWRRKERSPPPLDHNNNNNNDFERSAPFEAVKQSIQNSFSAAQLKQKSAAQVGEEDDPFDITAAKANVRQKPPPAETTTTTTTTTTSDDDKGGHFPTFSERGRQTLNDDYYPYRDPSPMRRSVENLDALFDARRVGPSPRQLPDAASSTSSSSSEDEILRRSPYLCDDTDDDSMVDMNVSAASSLVSCPDTDNGETPPIMKPKREPSFGSSVGSQSSSIPPPPQGTVALSAKISSLGTSMFGDPPECKTLRNGNNNKPVWDYSSLYAPPRQSMDQAFVASSPFFGTAPSFGSTVFTDPEFDGNRQDSLDDNDNKRKAPTLDSLLSCQRPSRQRGMCRVGPSPQSGASSSCSSQPSTESPMPRSSPSPSPAYVSLRSSPSSGQSENDNNNVHWRSSPTLRDFRAEVPATITASPKPSRRRRAHYRDDSRGRATPTKDNRPTPFPVSPSSPWKLLASPSRGPKPPQQMRSNGDRQRESVPPTTPKAQLRPSLRDSPSMQCHQRKEDVVTSKSRGRSVPPIRQLSASERRRQRSLSRSRRASKMVMPIARPRTPSMSTGKYQDEREAFITLQAPSSPEHLSDVPSDVEEHVKARYLKACRLLKSTLINGDDSISESDKQFLDRLTNIDASENSRNFHLDSDLSRLQTIETFLSNPNPVLARTETHPTIPRPNMVTPDASLRSDEQWSWHVDDSKSSYEEEAPQAIPFSYTSSTLNSRCSSDDYPFLILGAEGYQPIVLTPIVMQGLCGFFPFAVAQANFFLKFSLERGGPSLPSLLHSVQGCRYTIFGVETMDGSVFGVFCSAPWNVHSSWFGSGESFLWRLKQPRKGQSRRHDGDNEIEIYPYTGHDTMIQFCTQKTLAVGGASNWGDEKGGCPFSDEPWGIGFLLDGDLMGGETNSCVTFANPRLCNRSQPSNEFEIKHLEVWTLTTAESAQEALQLESPAAAQRMRENRSFKR